MDELPEVARLNLVLELVSECAGLSDASSVANALGARLHWILDFERCTLMLRRDDEPLCLTMGSRAEGLEPCSLDGADPVHARLIERAMSNGAPACEGVAMGAVAYPLGTAGNPLGALCLERRTPPYSYRDLRLIHHISTSLGAVLARMAQQAAVDRHRRDARELAELAERERSTRAESAVSANDAFLAMLGHELRNPLAPILAAIELLRRKSGGAPVPEVETIERQARHLDRLVSDLLDVSRVTTGKVSLRRSALDLATVVNRAVEMARPLIERKRQNLAVVLPATPLWVHGDETRLCQVVSNLLNNASLYSAFDGNLQIRTELIGGEAVLSVIDDGIGIAPEMLGNIFQMFVQGGRSEELAPGGLGLGLGVARTLVELHGGRIVASSEGDGRGSRFTVRLPALAGPDVHAEAPPRREPIARDGPRPARRILLVDDNVDAADSMGALVRAAGHAVEIAYEPLHALSIAIEFMPQVVVLDIGLPTMDGYQLASELRARLGASLAVIALSGYGQERDRERSLASGFAAHLVKPAAVAELLDAIAGNVGGEAVH